MRTRTNLAERTSRILRCLRLQVRLNASVLSSQTMLYVALGRDLVRGHLSSRVVEGRHERLEA